MSEQNPYRLFVVHTFKEHEEYARVFEFLESKSNFFYLNQSDPGTAPASGNEQELQEVIRQQIKHAEVVLFPVGIYGQDPRLVDFELTVAQAFNKPVIAIMPFGGTINVPRATITSAVDTIPWDPRLIVDAIRHHGRGENTAKWDVIEFDPDNL